MARWGAIEYNVVVHSLILIETLSSSDSATAVVFQEFNDSLSVTYLASVQKSAGSVNDLADKFMLAFGHRRL